MFLRAARKCSPALRVIGQYVRPQVVMVVTKCSCYRQLTCSSVVIRDHEIQSHWLEAIETSSTSSSSSTRKRERCWSADLTLNLSKPVEENIIGGCGGELRSLISSGWRLFPRHPVTVNLFIAIAVAVGCHCYLSQSSEQWAWKWNLHPRLADVEWDPT